MANPREAEADPMQPGDADAPLRIQLLGGFRVAVGARAIADRAWKLRRATAIVKLLALAPERRLHRERVLDLLWPDLDPEVAAHNLNQALYIARRAREPALGRKQPSRYLPLRGQLLLLCPDSPLDLDVAAFERAAARAQDGDDPAAYRAALERYPGDLLPEDRYEDWASAPREALRARFHALLQAAATLHERDGRPEEASAALARLVADEPTHEAAHVGLMRLYALGGRRTQALQQYHLLHETLGRELAIAPEPASERLYQEILAGRFPAARSARAAPAAPDTTRPAHNLPTPLTPFIGRAGIVAELVAALGGVGDETPPTRLLTLTGAGGAGKSRLALAVATALVPRFPDGVWLVELAAIGDPALVERAVAQALAVKEGSGEPLRQTLVGALRERRLLLLLDNCEHLIAACAALAGALLARCPGVRILATSREALRLAGERPWRTPSLTLPAAAAEAEALAAAVRDSEAGQLFAQRAAFLQPGFAIDRANAAAVAAICRRLDGIPLAIELAAARANLLSVGEIAARFDAALPLLSGGDRAAPSRQWTLRATLDWSYDLLPVAERGLLRQLAVFAGGWTLQAAEAVCIMPDEATRPLAAASPEVRAAGAALPSVDLLAALAALVEKSLVQVDLGGGAARYRLLEMVRQYARSLPEAAAELAATARRHAEHYVALAEVTPSRWYTAQQAEQARRLDDEHDNLRAALAWGLAHPAAEVGPRIAGSLWVFWYARGALTEARHWLESALAHSCARELPAAYSQILNGIGYIANLQGDVEGAVAAYEERLAWQRARDDRAGLISTLGNYAALLRDQRRDYDRSYTLTEEALALAREIGSANQLLNLLNRLGLIVRSRGEYARARALHEEALRLARETGDRDNVSTSLGNLAMLALEQGDHATARGHYRECLVVLRQLAKAVHLVIPLTFLAEIAVAQGQPERAARLFGAAEALGVAQGYRLPTLLSERRERAVAALRDALAADHLAAAWAAGRALPLERALDEAAATD